MSISGIIIVAGIILQIAAVIYLVKTSRRKAKENVVTITTTNPQELEQFIQTHNIPPEMIEHLKNGDATFKSTKTVRTVKYVNGKIVSDEIKTTTNESPSTNFCPNCGAKMDNPNINICPYCNTNFNITK